MFLPFYFNIQGLTFTGLGIHLKAGESCYPQNLIKNPLLLYGMMLLASFHFMLISHYAAVHITDFVEVCDSLPLLCQLLLCILKMFIFLNKRQEILLLVKDVHDRNTKDNFSSKAKQEDLFILQRENSLDNYLSKLYLKIGTTTCIFGVLHPLTYGLYVYYTRGEIVFVEPNKASYFWDPTHLTGYLMVYALNVHSLYFTCTVSLAFDTLFSWFVSNIVAQFHITNQNFENLSRKCSKLLLSNDLHQLHKEVVGCIRYHRQTLYLSEHLSRVYGAMIFIKFLIVCGEICSLIFRVSLPNDSLADIVYKILFLCAVAIQLILYCWNGQRIKDQVRKILELGRVYNEIIIPYTYVLKSLQVGTAIYCAFDWTSVPKSYKKLLLFSMMRSQKSSHVTGVFFEVDLNLYLWVFKTAGSFYAALKTLDENKV